MEMYDIYFTVWLFNIMILRAARVVVFSCSLFILIIV